MVRVHRATSMRLVCSSAVPADGVCGRCYLGRCYKVQASAGLAFAPPPSPFRPVTFLSLRKLALPPWPPPSFSSSSFSFTLLSLLGPPTPFEASLAVTASQAQRPQLRGKQRQQPPPLLLSQQVQLCLRWAQPLTSLSREAHAERPGCPQQKGRTPGRTCRLSS